MFEDSLVESRVGGIPTNKRWTVASSIAVQCLLAALIIAVPLLHPAALPIEIAAPRVLTPILSKPPVPVRVRQIANAATATAMPVAAARPLLPSLLPHHGPSTIPPALASLHFGNGMTSVLGDAITSETGSSPTVTARPERSSGPLRVSTGVTAGLLLTPIQPVYPVIAKAAGIQGTVVVDAIISRTGTIESLRAVSGPEMLRGAAVEAIRSAKYRPYTLNGQPTDVQTTITVNFRIGG
ncbi:hypothetical protein GCM10011507_12590 [Edaphobacter acidisoli]|uniref:TonB C-terminal domain-containing protein n=1 Tax=Edaphobacter acidisoli TaxID=2040573 RepID=A0A916W2P3_9BACT|nr:energy transducer TonB [Edaphobacter acidisoli]GGA62534.1 hypothetical protein GCM10011507_12590 [Edaphobacter acidisoli]